MLVIPMKNDTIVSPQSALNIREGCAIRGTIIQVLRVLRVYMYG